MKVRNISDARWIASPNHDFDSEVVDHGEVVEVPDDLGVILCEQVEVWEPADAESKKQIEAAQRKADKAARAAGKDAATAPTEADASADKAGE